MASHGDHGSAPRLRVVVTDATDGLDAEVVAGELLPTDSVQEAAPQPAWGVRAESPGPRGCWALKADSTPCGAAKLKEADYCSAHSGRGVASDPAGWSPLARERSADSRRRRAALRLELGITRPSSIRGMLRGAVHVERERVVDAALSPIRDPNLGSAAKQRAALALLDAVEPQPKAALDLPLDQLDPEGIAGLGLSELRALAERVAPLPLPATSS